jgi:hypothetical protein
MQEKALMEIDLRIERLRSEMASGKTSFEAVKELDALIESRISLVHAIGKAKDSRNSVGGNSVRVG